MRRRTEAVEDDALVVPEHLRVCWVEDWVDPVEEAARVPDWWTDRPSLRVALLARRRWRVAAHEWLTEHGVNRWDERRELIPSHAPRWRDQELRELVDRQW